MDKRLLSIELLLRYGILFPQRFVALEVDDGIIESRLVSRRLAFCLLKLYFERTAVDDSEDITRVHPLAFPVADLH